MAPGAAVVDTIVFIGQSDSAATCQGTSHRDGVGEFKVPPVRDTAGDARCSHAQRPELALEQKGRSLAIYAGGSGYDDLGDAVCADTIDQSLHRQVLRSNAFEGGKQLAENEVTATHRAGS